MCIFQIFNIIALPLSCTKTHNVPYPILNKFIHIFVRPQYWYCSIAAPILVRAWKYVVSDENIVQRWVWFSDFIRKHMSQQKASQFSTIFSLESFLLGNYLHSYSRWSIVFIQIEFNIRMKWVLRKCWEYIWSVKTYHYPKKSVPKENNY